MSPATAGRRRLIRKLLADGEITSQASLVELLDAEGYPVTQATVSRDLDALGAIKVRADNGSVRYSLSPSAERLSEAEMRLRRAVNDFVEELPTDIFAAEDSDAKALHRTLNSGRTLLVLPVSSTSAETL